MTKSEEPWWELNEPWWVPRVRGRRPSDYAHKPIICPGGCGRKVNKHQDIVPSPTHPWPDFCPLCARPQSDTAKVLRADLDAGAIRDSPMEAWSDDIYAKPRGPVPGGQYRGGPCSFEEVQP